MIIDHITIIIARKEDLSSPPKGIVDVSNRFTTIRSTPQKDGYFLNGYIRFTKPHFRGRPIFKIKKPLTQNKKKGLTIWSPYQPNQPFLMVRPGHIQ